MREIQIKDEYIKLGQALKLAGMVGSGVEAKWIIQDGLISVNGKQELRRGCKLHPGDKFQFEEDEVKVVAL